jgi:antirestriction protein ArdC
MSTRARKARRSSMRIPTLPAAMRTQREIHFLKGYTVFNVEQIEGLRAAFYATVEKPALAAPARIAHAEQFFAATRLQNDVITTSASTAA